VQQAEPWLPVDAIHHPQQARLDELCQRVLPVRANRPAGVAEVLRGDEVRATGCDRQQPQRPRRRGVEQVVGPADGLAKRPVPGGPVDLPGHQGQPTSQTLEQLPRRQQAEPDGGDLDGQRQAVQGPADLADIDHILLGG
jgi:hypothetical protein